MSVCGVHQVPRSLLRGLIRGGFSGGDHLLLGESRRLRLRRGRRRRLRALLRELERRDLAAELLQVSLSLFQKFLQRRVLVIGGDGPLAPLRLGEELPVRLHVVRLERLHASEVIGVRGAVASPFRLGRSLRSDERVALAPHPIPRHPLVRFHHLPVARHHELFRLRRSLGDLPAVDGEGLEVRLPLLLRALHVALRRELLRLLRFLDEFFVRPVAQLHQLALLRHHLRPDAVLELHQPQLLLLHAQPASLLVRVRGGVVLYRGELRLDLGEPALPPRLELPVGLVLHHGANVALVRDGLVPVLDRRARILLHAAVPRREVVYGPARPFVPGRQRAHVGRGRPRGHGVGPGSRLPLPAPARAAPARALPLLLHLLVVLMRPLGLIRLIVSPQLRRRGPGDVAREVKVVFALFDLLEDRDLLPELVDLRLREPGDDLEVVLGLTVPLVAARRPGRASRRGSAVRAAHVGLPPPMRFAPVLPPSPCDAIEDEEGSVRVRSRCAGIGDAVARCRVTTTDRSLVRGAARPVARHRTAVLGRANNLPVRKFRTEGRAKFRDPRGNWRPTRRRWGARDPSLAAHLGCPRRSPLAPGT